MLPEVRTPSKPSDGAPRAAPAAPDNVPLPCPATSACCWPPLPIMPTKRKNSSVVPKSVTAITSAPSSARSEKYACALSESPHTSRVRAPNQGPNSEPLMRRS
eukprot:scaffold11435_cov30-Tisochrysis_lutea.AAC.3